MKCAPVRTEAEMCNSFLRNFTTANYTSIRSIIKYLFHVTFMRLANFSNIKSIKFTFITSNCAIYWIRDEVMVVLMRYCERMIANCVFKVLRLLTATFSHFSQFLKRILSAFSPKFKNRQIFLEFSTFVEIANRV